MISLLLLLHLVLVGERLNRLDSEIEVEILSVEPCKQVDIV